MAEKKVILEACIYSSVTVFKKPPYTGIMSQDRQHINELSGLVPGKLVYVHGRRRPLTTRWHVCQFTYPTNI